MSQFLITNSVGLALDKLRYLKEDRNEFDHFEDYIDHTDYVVYEVIGHLQEALDLLTEGETK